MGGLEVGRGVGCLGGGGKGVTGILIHCLRKILKKNNYASDWQTKGHNCAQKQSLWRNCRKSVTKHWKYNRLSVKIRGGMGPL